ncbi:MAG: ABC transporter ATP-binding protein [Planctomycetota bacterium]|nr:ABC transporter ATP-binding protein [Planctomycetota bacterium]
MTIRIRNLEFAYPSGGFELRVEALDIARGETVALVGPSGCGKTTVLHLVAGITVPDTGSVEVDDKLVSALDEPARSAFRARHIGPVFQEFELLEYLNVLENLLLPYRIAPGLQLDDTVRERARALASDLGLGAKLARRPRQLSQGERQRVAIGRALLPEPTVLLADEPTGNLDPTTSTTVLDLLLEHANRQDASLLTVTHDHALLPRFDRVLEMGDLVRPGSPA